MASQLLRKRKQDLSPSNLLQKYLRVEWSETENDDFQDDFCVYCKREMDDNDCVVVYEKIAKKRERCQNPACRSAAPIKVQKASRRIQEFYGHSYRVGQTWMICEVCYLQAEQHLENSDGGGGDNSVDDNDDVVVLESFKSLHNQTEALTKGQPKYSKIKTILKYSRENPFSSTKTDIMNGSVIDKGNTDLLRVPVHAATTSGILEGGYTKKTGTELSSQNHQVFSQGDVTECAPVQCIPFQQLLNQGLSVFGTQPGTTETQEILENKHQQPCTQLSEGHTNQQQSVALDQMLQHRFFVLNPPTKTTFGQENQQQEGHQLQHQKCGIQHDTLSVAQRHADVIQTTKSSSCSVRQMTNKEISEEVPHTTTGLENGTHLLNGHAPHLSQQKHNVENVASIQQEFSKIGKLHTSSDQQSKQQTSQVHRQPSGLCMPQNLGEQCVQLVPPQTIGCTPPQCNVQLTSCPVKEDKSQFPQHSNGQNKVGSHNEHSISKMMLHHCNQTPQFTHDQSAQQNNIQFLSLTSLKKSEQHVIPSVQDSSAQNTYRGLKNSIRQTVSELPSASTQKEVLHLPQSGGRSLACTKKQPSEHVPQHVQQNSGQCILQPIQQSVSPSLQQSSEDIVLKIPNQYSRQIMVQMSGLNNQKCIPQSVHSEPQMLKHQAQQQKQHDESDIILTGHINKERETGCYLQGQSDSNRSSSPLISSKTVQNICMTDEYLKQLGPSISELGLKQFEQQQQQQENRSDSLQHLRNNQCAKTELKLDPIIPLWKSQEGNLQHCHHQMTSSVPISQVLYQQLRDLFRNNVQLEEDGSQHSLVFQFTGNISAMLQEQQVKMVLGAVSNILAQFLPIVTQQQYGKDSAAVEAAPSLMNTDSSQEQNLKMIANPVDLRLLDEEENEVSDTEFMGQSSTDNLTSDFSSSDSDSSVSDFTGGHSEKDVVPLGNVIIEENHLPPLGMLKHPSLAVGHSVYIMTDIRHPWVFGTVKDIVSQDNQKLYTVEFWHYKNKKAKKKIKEATGFQLAYPKVQDFRFSVGHRVISVFWDRNSDEEYFSGVIGEPPKSINHYRYLIFFDNGSVQYVKHEDIRLVVDSSPSVWEDVPKENRDFVQKYLQKYPERAMLKVQEGQYVSTEWNGVWYNAKVLQVDASLAQIGFPPKGKYVQWIYRGSSRFYQLFEACNRTCKKQFARTKAFSRKICDPYIQYTVREEEELDIKIKEEHEASIEEFEPTYHSAARMNTSSQITDQYLPLSSLIKPPKRKFYPCYSQVSYKAHMCKPLCLLVGNSEKDYGSHRNLFSHLSEPLLYGWTREKVKHSDSVCVYYRAPCKRRLRNIEELHKYLLKTKSKFTIDQFDFNHWVRCFSEVINEESFIKIEDISNGVEAVPVPCINTIDTREPDKIMYVTKYVPTKGTYIETDPEFLTCCNCADDCLDKKKCACWRLTMDGVKYGPENESLSNKGYYYKRLYEPLVTGIYECNSRCKCSSACLNRLVQLPMKCKIQVFMTPNRGWGVRTLQDIPKGSYICLYAGLVLPEKVGDALAEEEGDEYQADLNYIEDAEKIKEDYEENPYENELNKGSTKKQNSKRKGQNTTSRKLTGKMYKIVTPSTRVLFGRNGRYILDAKTCGNVGRFINHSCMPNLFVQNVFVDTHDLRFPHVAFFTKSFVPASTELTWNYGYDVGSVPDRVIICKCGEINCQGRLL